VLACLRRRVSRRTSIFDFSAGFTITMSVLTASKLSS
jgi:hypothetical protein